MFPYRFLFLAVLLVASPLGAQQQVVAGTAAGDPGDSVEVPLTFAGAGSAVVFQVDVTYDPSALSISATNGTALGAHVLASATPAPGRLRLVVHATDNSLLTDGELARLNVTVDSFAPGGVDQPLVLDAAVLGDANATGLAAQFTAGNVTVGTGPLPRVLDVTTVPASTRFGWTQVRIRFSEALYDPAGDTTAGDVTRPGSYFLVADGGDGIFETVDCAGGAAPEDTVVPVDSVIYDGPTETATLRLNGTVPPPAGKYRLLICNAVTDLNQNALDGDSDGVAGDDHARLVPVEMTNLLKNPNFDDSLAFWIPASPAQAEILYHSDDAEGVPTSGSAQVMNLSGTNQVFALAQCVTLDGSESYRTGGRVRILSGLPADPVDFATVDFFATPDCTGTMLGTVTSNAVLGDTAGQWSRALADVVDAPAGSVSAQVAFVIEAGASSDFVGHFDSVFFAGKTDLWSDGFETGDTSMWSSGQGIRSQPPNAMP